ncbi:imidazole glycerol phosphate synthase glutamine amidotransferase subunit [Gammaproteobacteria bacterium]|nr:imidazole glycerol phosphate synthase glutamine amidotransferase subunit [Gammaproteobacteria bacterium]
MAKPILAIVDYGSGNIRSVYRAIKSQTDAFDVRITDSPEILEQAQRIILPGQSAIRDCMAGLTARNLIEPLKNALKNKPCLAICIGPQALLTYSDENDGVETIGHFAGTAQHFNKLISPEIIKTEQIKIPHIGWNQVTQKPHALWAGIPQQSYFYFVHSYYLSPASTDIIVGTTKLGVEFASVIAQDNVFGAQFHPEKSDQVGLKLLKNFTLWQP